ncbi:sensor histidine kinase [Claveliimonas bilis]|uniref:sensor histidine kinase n=1 Tax=Claveliimonas bilis TaxID=3028070 RepID=UPI001E58AE0C|nr:HAMP domain-containing sensor histidine kinase [Claveliimonas bilis]
MVIWLLLLCIVLAITVFILGIKLFLIRKAAIEICDEFSEKLKSDTNTLISISTDDKIMCYLTKNINIQLKELRLQRLRYMQGDLELKNAVTNISHDLRTPLTAISSYLDLLDKEEKNETIERYIGIIKNRTETLIQLTEELFRYSIITSPNNNIKLEPVSVNRILEDSILQFYATLQERGITPSINITEKKVVRNLSSVELSRIFSNILSNAVKYSDGDLNVTLTDNGIIQFSNTAFNLNDVQVERLFDRFYTLENARKSTGLGLSISKILVEQMNGTISAKYEKEKLNISIEFPNPTDD